jgi:hypothetical protein
MSKTPMLNKGISKTRMYRKSECKGCGYVQETITSYYLDKKEWQLTHPNYHWNKMYLIQSRRVVG